MNITITVLSATRQQATSKAGKPYSYVELAYKGDDGQVRGKKVMPFGEFKAVHDALAQAQGGEVYNITAIKNEASGYWDWTAASKSDGSAPAPQASGPSQAGTSSGGKVTGSNYETAEERAKKQVFIVRQSSISAAINFLVDAKKSSTVEQVIDVAKQFEAYVFNTGTVDKPAAIHKAIPEINDGLVPGIDYDTPL